MKDRSAIHSKLAFSFPSTRQDSVDAFNFEENRKPTHWLINSQNKAPSLRALDLVLILHLATKDIRWYAIWRMWNFCLDSTCAHQGHWLTCWLVAFLLFPKAQSRWDKEPTQNGPIQMRRMQRECKVFSTVSLFAPKYLIPDFSPLRGYVGGCFKWFTSHSAHTHTHTHTHTEFFRTFCGKEPAKMFFLEKIYAFVWITEMHENCSAQPENRNVLVGWLLLRCKLHVTLRKTSDMEDSTGDCVLRRIKSFSHKTETQNLLLWGWTVLCCPRSPGGNYIETLSEWKRQGPAALTSELLVASSKDTWWFFCLKDPFDPCFIPSLHESGTGGGSVQVATKFR